MPRSAHGSASISPVPNSPPAAKASACAAPQSPTRTPSRESRSSTCQPHHRADRGHGECTVGRAQHHAPPGEGPRLGRPRAKPGQASASATAEAQQPPTVQPRIARLRKLACPKAAQRHARPSRPGRQHGAVPVSPALSPGVRTRTRPRQTVRAPSPARCRPAWRRRRIRQNGGPAVSVQTSRRRRHEARAGCKGGVAPGCAGAFNRPRPRASDTRNASAGDRCHHTRPAAPGLNGSSSLPAQRPPVIDDAGDHHQPQDQSRPAPGGRASTFARPSAPTARFRRTPTPRPTSRKPTTAISQCRAARCAPISACPARRNHAAKRRGPAFRR